MCARGPLISAAAPSAPAREIQRGAGLGRSKERYSYGGTSVSAHVVKRSGYMYGVDTPVREFGQCSADPSFRRSNVVTEAEAVQRALSQREKVLEYLGEPVTKLDMVLWVAPDECWEILPRPGTDGEFCRSKRHCRQTLLKCYSDAMDSFVLIGKQVPPDATRKDSAVL